MEQPELITTNINGATYTHLPTRDLTKDLKRAQRKWNSKPRVQQTPVLHEPMGKGGTLIGRTLDHYSAKLVTLGDDPMRVLIVTLFNPSKPQCVKFNRELELFALRDSRIHLQYVDPVDWGLD